MFERYTEVARRTIFFARYEASHFGASAIEPEHLLLGLSREDKPLFIRFLGDGKQSIETIRTKLEERLSMREKEKTPTSVELPLSDEAKRALHYAHDESYGLEDRHIGTEHMLLGLTRVEGSLAAEVLFELGLRAEAMREVLAQKTEAPRSYKIQATHPQSSRRIVLGVEKLLKEQKDLLRGARVGLVCNQASVDHDFHHVADLFHEHPDVNLTTLFGPQHG